MTFGDLFTMQPFGTSLTVMMLMGAQINTLLEERLDNSGVAGIALNGVALGPADSYRVTANSFLADGGDGFKVLASGTSHLGGDLDVDAFAAYIQRGGKVQAKSQKRIITGGMLLDLHSPDTGQAVAGLQCAA